MGMPSQVLYPFGTGVGSHGLLYFLHRGPRRETDFLLNEAFTLGTSKCRKILYLIKLPVSPV